jgi:mono/diheme cytochrome c family protein
MVAATLVKGGSDPRVQDLLQWVADDSRAAWQRQALLKGAEAALLGAALPGTPGRGGTGAGGAPGAGGRGGGGRGNAGAADAAPGARGGPGGAPAFARAGAGAGAAAGAGRGRGAGGPPPLALTREPAAFAALAAKGGELGPRATTLLARLTWPGKPAAPGAAPPPPPLTAAEQQRFDAGQTVYAGLCIACHQADGKGLEKVAPTLVGSTLLLAPPGIPIRILLHGKEGTVGLMPPLGSGLTDDQIASVLTYVRRSWGNGGSAVDAATVKDTRTQTTTRTKPWTNAELAAIGGAGQRP